MSTRKSFVQNAAVAIFAATSGTQTTDSHGRAIAVSDTDLAKNAVARAEVLAEVLGVVDEAPAAELPEAHRRTGTERK
jgi:hypothetical protein